MTSDEWHAKLVKEEQARIAAMPVWLVKWKSDGKYLASDRKNEWTTDRDAAFRFPTRTNADMVRRAIGASAFYTRLVRLVRKPKRGCA